MAARTMVGKIKAEFYDDGNIAVTGIPLNLDRALKMWNAVLKAIIQTFIKAAADGKLSENSVIEKSPIVLPPANMGGPASPMGMN